MNWRDNYDARANAEFDRRLEESEAARKALLALGDERVREEVRKIVRAVIAESPNA